MNLSPDWIPALASSGIDAVHWSEVGDPRAADAELLAYARNHDMAILTHDLDFGTLLALTQARGPSVLQVRTQAVLPASLGPVVVRAIHRFEPQLDAGVLMTVDELTARVRVLPIK